MKNHALAVVQRFAPSILWLVLAVQMTWVILNSFFLHRSPGLDVLGVIILLTFIAFAARHQHPRWRWMAVIVRALMAADFLLAVADRFGVLGPPGAPGVFLGDFAHFVDYTRSVASFLPGSLAPTLAVLATIAEVSLAMALLLGFRLRLAAYGAALLLSVYGTSMMISLPVAEQFHYNVFLLAAGMLTLSLARSPLTVDAALTKLGSRQSPARPELEAAAASPETWSRSRQEVTWPGHPSQLRKH